MFELTFVTPFRQFAFDERPLLFEHLIDVFRFVREWYNDHSFSCEPLDSDDIVVHFCSSEPSFFLQVPVWQSLETGDGDGCYVRKYIGLLREVL